MVRRYSGIIVPDPSRSGMKTHHINPEALSPPNGYSQVVIVDGFTKLIFVSGQIPLDAEGSLVGTGDLKAQLRQVITDLR